MISPVPQYASFFHRCLAVLIDYFLVVLVLSILITIAISLGFLEAEGFLLEQNGQMVPDLSQSWKPAPYLLFGSLWLYFTVMHTTPWGATFGKRLFGLYVADKEGHRLSFGSSAIRSLGWVFSFFTLFIGFLLALVHPKRQSLHDLLARSYVMRW